MKNGGSRHGSMLTDRLFRDRWPIVAIVGVQALVAGYLCLLKVRADSFLQPGQKYFSIFYHLLATVDWPGALLGLLFLVAALLLPPQRWIDDTVAWLGRNVRLVAVAVLLSGLAVVAHRAYPFTMDEYAPSFQAQVFARGRLTGQWPPEIARLLVSPDNVDWFFVMSPATGRVCSEYWPGQAFLMTPFAFLGIPWAFNPILSGCAIVLLAAVVRKAFGEQAVGWAVLFAIGSPVFAAYGISFYAMTAHFTLNLLYSLLLLFPTLPRVAGAGLVGGFALTLHNPFPHFIFSLPWLGWLGLRPDRWTRLPLIACCYAAVFLPIDVGWRRLEDSIRGSRSAAVKPAADDAAPVAGSGPPADTEAAAPVLPPTSKGVPAPSRLVPMVSASIATIRAYFFSVVQFPSSGEFWQGRIYAFLRLVAWDAPGIVVLAAWGFWHNRNTTAARLFALSGLTTFLGYSLIAVNGGHGWGYRYFFASWSCLPVLAAGLAAYRFTGATGKPSAAAGRVARPAEVLRAAGFAAVLSLAICLPVRLWQIHGFIVEHLGQLPPKPLAHVGSDVVSFLDLRHGYFRNDLIRNDPFFEHGPYVFVSHGPDNDKRVIEALAELVGLQARMTFVDQRGSTWVLEPAAPREGKP